MAVQYSKTLFSWVRSFSSIAVRKEIGFRIFNELEGGFFNFRLLIRNSNFFPIFCYTVAHFMKTICDVKTRNLYLNSNFLNQYFSDKWRKFIYIMNSLTPGIFAWMIIFFSIWPTIFERYNYLSLPPPLPFPTTTTKIHGELNL